MLGSLRAHKKEKKAWGLDDAFLACACLLLLTSDVAGRTYSHRSSGAGLPFTNRIEATIVDLDPDGGPQAALFPELDKAYWHYDIMEEVAADGDIPGYRYERFTRKAPVSVQALFSASP